MAKEKNSQPNVSEQLQALQKIADWFDAQTEVDVETGLKKVKEAAVLISASQARLKEIENEFVEIKKLLDEKDRKINANNPQEEPKSSVLPSSNVSHSASKQLPKTRNAKTFEFRVADCKGYVTVGEFDDGTPAEIFLQVSKQGSTLAGIMDSFAISISRGLRNGVPLKSYVSDFIGMSFAPAGVTDDPEIRTASSLMDYIFRKIAKDYLSLDDQLELGLVSMEDLEKNEGQVSLLGASEKTPEQHSQLSEAQGIDDSYGVQEPADQGLSSNKDAQEAPLCFNCGNITQRAGSCYVCTACGSTSGCS